MGDILRRESGQLRREERMSRFCSWSQVRKNLCLTSICDIIEDMVDVAVSEMRFELSWRTQQLHRPITFRSAMQLGRIITCYLPQIGRRKKYLGTYRNGKIYNETRYYMNGGQEDD